MRSALDVFFKICGISWSDVIRGLDELIMPPASANDQAIEGFVGFNPNFAKKNIESFIAQSSKTALKNLST